MKGSRQQNSQLVRAREGDSAAACADAGTRRLPCSVASARRAQYGCGRISAFSHHPAGPDGRMPVAPGATVPSVPRHQAVVERHFADPATAADDVRASRVSAVVATHVARHRSAPIQIYTYDATCRGVDSPLGCHRDVLLSMLTPLRRVLQHSLDLLVCHALALSPPALE